MKKILILVAMAVLTSCGISRIYTQPAPTITDFYMQSFSWGDITLISGGDSVGVFPHAELDRKVHYNSENYTPFTTISQTNNSITFRDNKGKAHYVTNIGLIIENCTYQTDTIISSTNSILLANRYDAIAKSIESVEAEIKRINEEEITTLNKRGKYAQYYKRGEYAQYYGAKDKDTQNDINRWEDKINEYNQQIKAYQKELDCIKRHLWKNYSIKLK